MPSADDHSIVFLHGLTGGRLTTFTHRNGKCWPRDFLPQVLPDARIMSYGYDANVVSLGAMAGQNSLEGNAKSLLEALIAARQDDTKPLIFVTHSLGGLLCKQALLMAHNRPEYKSIFDAYAGIVFIGTPHKGSKQAKLGNLFVSFINIFRSANTEIVAMLRLQSKPLLMLDDDFWALMDGEKKNCAVHCYNESAPMGTLGYIVDPVSAARPGGSSSPLDGNHSSMLKFATEQDNGYLTLSTKLKGWYNNLPSSTLVSTTIVGNIVAASAVHISTDLVFSLIPITFIRKLQRPRGEKIFLGILMGLGLFASSFAILRTVKASMIPPGGDTFFMTVAPTLWSMLELELALIAATIPTLKGSK
ncbi:hypothetical protein J4E89_005741 [Alternaria sp. Ai002NY15]|nr:hypothetical protein J4E89_005741 [Alternaria sp. Ai002NY15]